MKMKIRKATIKDFKTFQSLNGKLFKYDKKHDPALDLDWPFKKVGIDYYKKVLTDKDSVCFIAEDENKKSIGYVAGGITDKFGYRKAKIVELQNIFILKKYRRQGIGRQLVKELLAWARIQRADKFFVSTYFKDKKATSFYKKSKFKPIDLGLEQDI
jgi:GNAT superfamily N-acetyltransferase